MYNNSKKIIAFAVALVFFFAGKAISQTRVLGLFELGKSTYNEVKAKLPEGVKILHDRSTPGDYGGPGIKTDGNGYSIQGLKGVSFGFDQKKALTVIFLRLEDRRFNDIKKIIYSKYQQVSSYPGVWLLFKANRDYVYLYLPGGQGGNDISLQYLTGTAYRHEQLEVRQTAEDKKALERREQKRLERKGAEEAAKF